MGINHPIEQPNGIITNYHRITGLSILPNGSNVIEVSSYISASKRQEEAEHIARLMAGDNDASCDVFINAKVYSTDYDPTMTIESAYEHIMSLPEFEGAEMEDTEYMLDAIETVPEIEAELAEQQQQADIQQPQEDGDVE